jgi:hypothetical protein
MPEEMAFRKIKALGCEAAERTIPGLYRRIGKLLGTFSVRECANFLTRAGHASTCRNAL